MIKHYFDFDNLTDKLVHILYVAKIEDALGLVIVELTNYYGENTIKDCINICKIQYPYIFN
ncbi:MULTISPECIES: hypothetical protein [Clostridium]|uniref:hypothetical protein n=1 Tax=Clostridium TaxID=1485 RepID=UPI000773383F|nr:MULTISPECIES: hypothetical protein [Clostridium]MBN1041747.1 hypothetical protein [Clostridium botulinum]MBY7024275.1 hypothetical protein [Clostridium botulinum]NFE95304.1 hypothetical protein [Clostridium botulinum]NFL39011.1 hypothetical protein [Clostridium botulinum]NFL66730.1 hypothetical protein [Clostridium botulinum]